MMQSCRQRFALFLAFAALLVAHTSRAQAGEKGPVPEGVYTLMKISGRSLINLGEIEIRKSTYRDQKDGKFKDFKINDKGEITWSKPLVFLPENWKHIRSEFAGKDKEGRPVLRIYYESARGASEVIDGIKEK